MLNQTNKKGSYLVYFLLFILPLLIPTAMFSTMALFEGLSFVEVFTATAKQCAAKRQNLLVCGTIGLFPILLLLGLLWIYQKVGGDKETKKLMAWSGLFSIILVLLWVNWEVWPHFLPGRPYPGFPHGLESIVGPFLFAPVMMFVTIGAVWILCRVKK